MNAAIIAFARLLSAQKPSPCANARSLHTCRRKPFAAATSHRSGSGVTHRARAKLPTCILFLVSLAATSHLTAQDNGQIQTELIAEVRIDAVRGPVPKPARFVAATLVSQGQVVYYTVRIRNVSSEYAHDVIVTQRIPANTVYVKDSASGPGADVFFSIDGGQTFVPADELATTDASGVRRPVPLDQYTHIRWHLRNPISPGGVALARFRAIFQ